jgi:hypothetical protein
LTGPKKEDGNMSANNSEQDNILEELQEIKSLLQDLVIIEGAKAGLTKSRVRKMLKIASDRVSSVWQYLDIDGQ